MLTQMINESGVLKDKTLPEQTILMKLAARYQENTNFLFLDPEELQTESGIGTKEQWTELLRLQETQNFLKGQMQFLSQIAQRKTFQSLVTSALGGNAQAAKQVQELSGVLNQVDSNKVIVLHYVPRPKEQEVTNDN
jgi:chromosome condensin MukBEF MukE localization factor